MIYETIKKLSKEKGISINQLEKALELSKGSLCRIDMNRPSVDRLQRIADYFGVTIDYLMIGKEKVEKKETALTSKDERDISKRLDETLNQLESGDGLMFDGEALDDNTKELLKISLENALRTAKVTAKKKFAPKKYQ